MPAYATWSLIVLTAAIYLIQIAADVVEALAPMQSQVRSPAAPKT